MQGYKIKRFSALYQLFHRLRFFFNLNCKPKYAESLDLLEPFHFSKWNSFNLDLQFQIVLFLQSLCQIERKLNQYHSKTDNFILENTMQF